MATLLAAATGQFTASTSFALAEGANLARNTTQSSAFTTAVTSPAFALVAGSVYDGVMLFIKNINASPTGTLTVELLKSGVVQASVTVNKSDLSPFGNTSGVLYNTPTFFKFGATFTGDATVTWTVRLSGTGTLLGYTTASSLVTNFSRLFRTTTLQAPGAGDNLYICGEHSGQGTVTNLTITMNSTTNTTYGSGVVNTATIPGSGIHIGKAGGLIYPSAENTNSILRIAGDLVLWAEGLFRIGAPVNFIPASSTAILEFVPTSVSGDMGFINYDRGTLTIKGAPRTDGKPVYFTKAAATGVITASFVAGTSTLTDISDMSCFISGAVGTLTVQGAGIPAGTTTSVVNVGGRRVALSAAPTADGTNVPIRVYYTAGGKSLYVNDDTGWLAGDLVAISSSSPTSGECELGVLTENAGSNYLAGQGFIQAASSLSVNVSGTGGFLFNHDGSASPLASDVILLSRNVKIRSTSTSLMSYMLIGNSLAPNTATIYGAEFQGMGANTTVKAGLAINGLPASMIDVQYCSFHSCLSTAVCFNANASAAIGGWSFQNNVFWNVAATSGNAMSLPLAVTDNSWVITNNVVVRTLSGSAVSLNDAGGIFTNNVICGAQSHGLVLQETTPAYFGNFDNNSMHSNGNTGFYTTSVISGFIKNLSTMRNGQYGFSPPVHSGLNLDGFIAYGNALGGFGLNSGFTGNIKNSYMGSDYLYSQAAGIVNIAPGYSFNGTLDNVELGGPYTNALAYTSHTTGDMNFPFIFTANIIMRNSKMTSPTDIATQSNLNSGSSISSGRHNGVAGYQANWARNGRGRTDFTIFNTAAPSEKLQAITTIGFTANVTAGSNVLTNVTSFDNVYLGTYLYSSSLVRGNFVVSMDKLNRTITLSGNGSSTASRLISIISKYESGSKLIPMDAGNTVNVTVFVRTSLSADGAAYVGSPPRLIQKANPALGIPNDVVLGTYNRGNGVWDTITGTTVAPNDDGMIEVLVDCDTYTTANNFTGFINVDDWSVS